MVRKKQKKQHAPTQERENAFLLVRLALRFRWLGGTIWQRRHWEGVESILSRSLGNTERKDEKKINKKPSAFQDEHAFYLFQDEVLQHFLWIVRKLGFLVAMLQCATNFREGGKKLRHRFSVGLKPIVMVSRKRTQ